MHPSRLEFAGAYNVPSTSHHGRVRLARPLVFFTSSFFVSVGPWVLGLEYEEHIPPWAVGSDTMWGHVPLALYMGVPWALILGSSILFAMFVVSSVPQYAVMQVLRDYYLHSCSTATCKHTQGVEGPSSGRGRRHASLCCYAPHCRNHNVIHPKAFPCPSQVCTQSEN